MTKPRIEDIELLEFNVMIELDGKKNPNGKPVLACFDLERCDFIEAKPAKKAEKVTA
mgnify:CR=1 FL=1